MIAMLSLLLLGVVASLVPGSVLEETRGQSGQRLEDRVDRLEQVLYRLEAENQRLRDNNEQLEKTVSFLTDRNDQLEKTVSSLVDKTDRLERSVSSLKDRNDQLDKTVSSLVDENDGLQISVSTLKDRNAQLEKNILELLSPSDKAPTPEGPPSASDLRKDQETTSSARVVVRSEDHSPLEPVVNQLSQKLTATQADVQAISVEIQSLKDADTQQDVAIQEAGSSVYVRWGRSVCPHSEHLVYSGVIGGSYYNHYAAASNALCLTLSPVFSNHAVPGYHADLYGAEYETSDFHHQKDPVCAVCRSQRPTTIMVPGTNVCMPGWTLEYSGYLMANHIGYRAGTDYLCVDSAQEYRLGGDANQNGLLLYYTRTVCGSLPCGPYVNNKVVMCAVCSQ